ncbi:prepilin-type N-terminal cleavage/methylation domain-containing protein [Halomonas sp. CKK8]|uniref:PilW family protein n=1 Tax=Halomonas sp. CKK8 TaxID=3036127 RepID=UPI002415220A|nr:prepilin-type N-terminal cleavage/methylation domain-containing protein [Halomonas sp. CKK8]WFM72924.1 prepilin-type N-terminal cleavage/methylation domain-containing protein [Halomonas sp. CKK8]
MMSTKQQAGFSLIELMVALVIGLVIMLAAGTTFLTIQRGMTRVNELAGQQSDLLFVTDTLLNELREAEPGTVQPGDDSFSLMLSSEQISYSISNNTIFRKVGTGSKEPVTTQPVNMSGEPPLLESGALPGTWRLNLVFDDNGEERHYSLIATQRNCIFSEVTCS